MDRRSSILLNDDMLFTMHAHKLPKTAKTRVSLLLNLPNCPFEHLTDQVGFPRWPLTRLDTVSGPLVCTALHWRHARPCRAAGVYWLPRRHPSGRQYRGLPRRSGRPPVANRESPELSPPPSDAAINSTLPETSRSASRPSRATGNCETSQQSYRKLREQGATFQINNDHSRNNEHDG